MRIVEIKNLTRKDLPIYYRRFYSGIAVTEMVNGNMEFPLDFHIEHKPTGNREISLHLSQKVDYPLIPLQKELKKYIGDLDSNGRLPK